VWPRTSPGFDRCLAPCALSDARPGPAAALARCAIGSISDVPRRTGVDRADRRPRRRRGDGRRRPWTPRDRGRVFNLSGGAPETVADTLGKCSARWVAPQLINVPIRSPRLLPIAERICARLPGYPEPRHCYALSTLAFSLTFDLARAPLPRMATGSRPTRRSRGLPPLDPNAPL